MSIFMNTGCRAKQLVHKVNVFLFSPARICTHAGRGQNSVLVNRLLLSPSALMALFRLFLEHWAMFRSARIVRRTRKRKRSEHAMPAGRVSHMEPIYSARGCATALAHCPRDTRGRPAPVAARSAARPRLVRGRSSSGADHIEHTHRDGRSAPLGRRADGSSVSTDTE